MRVAERALRLIAGTSSGLAERLSNASNGVKHLGLSRKDAVGLIVVTFILTATSVLATPGFVGLFGSALGLLMAAVAIFDWRYFIIPDELSVVALALGLSYVVVFDMSGPVQAIIAALTQGVVVGGLFYAVRIGYRWVRKREGIGLGDVKLAAVAGVWLSFSMIPIAVEISAITALCAYLLQRRLSAPSKYARLPFGAFFAPSIWFCWMLDVRIAVIP